MPPDDVLFSTFQPILAHNIASTQRRKRRDACFCDLALHHIQDLMHPIDVTIDCPEDGYRLLRGFSGIFTDAVVQDMNWEICAPTSTGVCSRADVNARIASETWERHFRPRLAKVLCIGLVDDAYEKAEEEAVKQELEGLGYVERFRLMTQRITRSKLAKDHIQLSGQAYLKTENRQPSHQSRLEYRTSGGAYLKPGRGHCGEVQEHGRDSLPYANEGKGLAHIRSVAQRP
ncbi:hypothetical protein OPT61_g196 [Boeremia exigua]|uniref:Uncharacterized protein n=1 Tax=Boeremia exigua TaxID=749465 RepID=A0ACC2IV28_9PLEO|nr:hypothetical protein OPT61_g196 [Boeremia exigua]